MLQNEKIGISRGKDVFHGFHGSIANFTGLLQKQPISRTRDTVKKEGPCWGGVLEGTYFKGIPILGGYLLSNSITDGVKEEKL